MAGASHRGLAWKRRGVLSGSSHLGNVRHRVSAHSGPIPQAWVWAVFLPAIALFYMAATIGSAVNYHRGRGVVWKGRAYAGGSP